MKSIKPGRGPSMMGGVAAIAAVFLGIIWIAAASDVSSSFSGGASPETMGSLFPLFGIVFVAIAIAMAVYHFKNAGNKNRFSEFDITEEDEEPDPLNLRFGKNEQAETGNSPSEAPSFCPYCGNNLEKGHIYCNRCGKKMQ